MGCSIRTHSHNLTLLPPRGYTNAYWHQPEANYGNNQTRLNLLLGPFPYAIAAGSAAE